MTGLFKRKKQNILKMYSSSTLSHSFTSARFVHSSRFPINSEASYSVRLRIMPFLQYSVTKYT
jgi:hypothetical protein